MRVDGLLRSPLAVINVGLEGFAEDLAAEGVPVVQADWSPPAGGDERLGGLGLNLTEDVVIGSIEAHLVHQLPQAKPRPETRVIVFGHSHRALAEWREGVLYLNPGAAGRAGFHTIQTVALLRVEGDEVLPGLVELGPRVRPAGAAMRRPP